MLQAVVALSLVVLAAGQCAPGLNQGLHRLSVSRPEGTRNFRVYVPRGLDTRNTRAPLIFYFHGWNNACDSSDRGYPAFADQKGFIFVAVCGYGNSWQAGPVPDGGTCCAPANVTPGLDDIALSKAIINDISNRVCIDQNRVFASGYSNGGMLSEILACTSADTFAAVASIAGVVEIRPGNAQGIQKCDQHHSRTNNRISVLAIHGDLDVVVPWTGNAALGFPTQTDNSNAWARRSGCNGGPRTGWTRGAFSQQIWDSCSNGVTHELIRHRGGAHGWPRVAGGVDSTAYAIEFFERATSAFPLNGTLPELKETIEDPADEDTRMLIGVTRYYEASEKGQ